MRGIGVNAAVEPARPGRFYDPGHLGEGRRDKGIGERDVHPEGPDAGGQPGRQQ